MTFRSVKKNVRVLGDIVAERAKGLDFSSFCEPEALGLEPERCYPYERSSPVLLYQAFDDLNIVPGDNLLDVGCGKGYALYLLRKRYAFSRTDGIEISPRLVDIARRNMMRLGLDVRIELADAAMFAGLDQYRYFYLFNPFPGDVMERFLMNLQESLLREPRSVTLVYSNPTCHRLLLLHAREVCRYEAQVDGFHVHLFVYRMEGSGSMMDEKITGSCDE